MFSKEIIDAVVAAADANHVPASALLAVVECETSGAPLESDGVTPRFLFERHKFYSELKRAGKNKELTAAIRQGLAIPKWSRSTQYKDQGTSAGRMAVMAKARAIDVECANRAASWGLGQVMGFNAERLGYANATEMVRAMTIGGIRAQLDGLMKEIKSSKLDVHLRNKNFALFALGYNGKGYKQNQYDTRMVAAEKRWARRVSSGDLVAHDLSVAEVRALQTRLKELGYPVGKIDGEFGDLTAGALSAFQRREGLPVTGKYDDETRKELKVALPRDVNETRAEATVQDLREAGSKTIAAADKGSFWAKILFTLGIGGGAEKTGVLDQAQEVVGKAETAKSIFDSAKGLIEAVAPYWWVAAIIVAFLMWQAYGDVIKERLRSHQTGENLSK